MGGSRKERREDGREGGWKRGGWKEGEEGRGQQGRGRRKGGGRKAYREWDLSSLLVGWSSSVRQWSRSFVRHCALIAMDGGVVVVWELVALVVWAHVSVNGMVVGAGIGIWLWSLFVVHAWFVV